MRNAMLMLILPVPFIVGACSTASTENSPNVDRQQVINKGESLSAMDTIHTTLPNIDYTHASIIQYISFDQRDIGEYTGELFKEDFHSAWGRLDAPAVIESHGTNKQLTLLIPKDKIKKGMHGAIALSNHNTLHFSYKVRFKEDYDFRLGGKLPGLGGLNKNVDRSIYPTGCRSEGQKPDHGFSLRVMFREQGKAVGYFYHQDNPNINNGRGNNNCGEDVPYQHKGDDFYFIPGQTYLIEQSVTMNSPNESNGRVHVYINGNRVLMRDNMVFSQTGQYGINTILLDIWHGGSQDNWAPQVNSAITIDDFALSTEPLSY
ncbi:hypothetical protein N9R79_07780 [Vibrio sp.]|nr:hypothetical protein [Vibrio sp.]